MTTILFNWVDARRAWVFYVLLTAALGLVFFGSTAEFGIDNHDAETFRDNARISKDFTYFFSADREQITGRPVADFCKWFASLLLGANPALFHLLVVFFHGLATLLFSRLLQQMGYDLELSFLAGLLFLVNATHFQAIHHISALDYPLALIFALLALLAYLRYDRSGNPLDMAAAYGFFILGVLSHMAIAALGPLCLYWSWRQGHPLTMLLRRLLPLGIVLGTLVLYSLYTTPRSTSTWASLEYYGQSEVSPLNALRLLAWFSGRLLTTAHWLPFTVYKQHGWELYCGTAILAGLFAVSWKKSTLVFWHGWIVLCLLPFVFIPEGLISYLLPEGPSRYLYLASAGSSVLLAWALLYLSARLGAAGRYVGAAALCIVLLFSYQALKRVEGFAYYTSGRHHIAADHIEKGTELLRRAIAQGGDAIPLRDAYLRLCMALLYLDHDSRAMATEALMRFPDDLMLGGIAAVLDGEDPRTRDRGYRWLQSALNRATGSGLGDVFKQHLSAVYVNLGKGYLRREDFRRAIDALQWARKLAPERAQIATTLSGAYTALAKAQRKRGEVFEDALKSALEIDAQNTEALRLVEEYIDYGDGS
jgi:tetratricopeptide (TPR) repeat protein